jgi:hypothetical protein
MDKKNNNNNNSKKEEKKIIEVEIEIKLKSYRKKSNIASKEKKRNFYFMFGKTFIWYSTLLKGVCNIILSYYFFLLFCKKR